MSAPAASSAKLQGAKQYARFKSSCGTRGAASLLGFLGWRSTATLNSSATPIVQAEPAAPKQLRGLHSVLPLKDKIPSCCPSFTN